MWFIEYFALLASSGLYFSFFLLVVFVTRGEMFRANLAQIVTDYCTIDRLITDRCTEVVSSLAGFRTLTGRVESSLPDPTRRDPRDLTRPVTRPVSFDPIREHLCNVLSRLP